MSEYHQSPAIGGGRGNTRRKGLNTNPPPKILNASTFDWDGQRDRYWRTLDWQADVQGSQNVDARLASLRRRGLSTQADALTKSNRSTPRVKARSEGKGKRYDRDEIVRLYVEERRTVTEIAEKLGCDDRTVREGLRARGVYEPDRDKKNPPRHVRAPETYVRRKTCGRGLHDMDKYGKEMVGKLGVDGQPKLNGRYCYACHMIRHGADPSRYETVDTSTENR